MAYATTDPLILLTTAGIASGPRLWYHESADAITAADADNFITDAIAKGLKVGDYVLHRDITSTTTNSSLHHVLASTAAPTTGVDLCNGTAVVTGTNSD